MVVVMDVDELAALKTRGVGGLLRLRFFDLGWEDRGQSGGGGQVEHIAPRKSGVVFRHVVLPSFAGSMGEVRGGRKGLHACHSRPSIAKQCEGTRLRVTLRRASLELLVR